MRPHRLAMTAFGPFPGTVEVDLDRLSASGLFLLHGETGAGKTTLLDGLGFALYGSVPGARQKGGRLRSDHADAAVRTQVQLEVTLGGRRWRITRSPAQERQKARGAGTTTEQARVLLEEQRAGSWATVSTRIEEAARELDPLLGMSADQFFQVVLLPQGEFATFLRAETKDRARLLQRLFGTERFRLVEDWLAARRSSTAATLAAARQDLQVRVARLAQAAGVVEPEEPSPAWTGRLVAAVSGQAADAAVAVTAAAGTRDGARRAAEAVARLADRQARRRAALEAQTLHAAQQPEHARLERELAAADRAAALAPVLTEAAHRRDARCASQEALGAARTALPAIGVAADAAPTALRRAANGARERAGRLEGLRALAEDLAREHDAQAQAAQQADRCARETTRVAAVLAGLPQRRAAAAVRVGGARAAAAALPQRSATLLALTAAVAEARSLAGVVAALEQLREEHLLGRETAVSLREKESELRDARLTSMVAELAATLEPGSPCEVCGSLQHPDPYEGAGDGVSREDEDHARALAEEAAGQVAAVEARMAAATATAAEHRRRLADAGRAEAGLVQLEAEQRELAADVRDLEGRAAELDGALADAERVEQEQVAGDAALARAAADGTAAGHRREEARLRAERLQARLVTELDGAPDLAAALGAATATSSACDTVLAAAEEARRAAAEDVRAAAAALAAAAAAGFDDPASAAAALRPAPWRETARASRREHDDRVAAVAAALADPELDVPMEPPADPDVATAAVRTADAALERAVGELAAAQARQTQAGRLAPQVDTALAGLAPLEEQASRARRLADLCAGGGGNALRMSLSSFVLAARLEQVAEAASGRLLRMTQGRYSLLHTDGTAKGGARSGLGLLVRDGWTGRDRDTGSLSGGETFQASLALALGLADVVQAEAGGTRIEALLVDEGFGTLDEETLDEVMDVLDGLREGGRVVGLVSHVAELRSRIPAQVHVRKGRQGSTLALEGC